MKYPAVTRWLGLALLLPGLTFGQAGDREAETEAELEQLRAEIAAIQRRVEKKTVERDDLQAALRDIDVRVADNDRQLARLQRRIRNILDQLRELDSEAQSLEGERRDLEAQLIEELRHLWGLRQGGGLKVLLGDQGPDRTARNLAYYQQLMSARTEAIAEYENLIVGIERNRKQQREAQQALAEQRAGLEKERDAAVKLQSDRKTTLAAIESSLSKDSDRIAKLEADSERLATLLDELRSSLAAMETPPSYRPFATAKEALAFPVNGRPSNRFGAKRNAGNLRWGGWLIPAREGSDVRAIHHGRVVYSDWLRGQGLLMILDHGDGWLSLYGHNRSLSAEVGDWVAPGDVIAQVGASGGATMPALYFEIRKDGSPVDPGRWLNR